MLDVSKAFTLASNVNIYCKLIPTVAEKNLLLKKKQYSLQKKTP